MLAWVLTDEPARVLVRDRRLLPVDEAGSVIGEPVVIERGRPYHRQWLLKFRDVDERTVLEGWRDRLLGVAREELTPPAAGELYEHEVPGARVLVEGEQIGVVRELIRVPAGVLLAVDVAGREVLVPFRRPIVRRVDRGARAIEVDPPPGLFDL